MVASFIAYDIAFLIIFTLAVVLFLYKRKQKLQREGLIYLYRTKLGLAFIEKFSKKYARILKPMQYLVITSGYILMISMMWLIITTLFIYLKQPDSSPLAKVPAVFPLIPYFPELFNLESIFPPFYFTYFLIAIAIIAISHECAHGIFARLNKIKIHSTGFAFLGPFLGAFVEQDEKQMNKAKKFPQLAILAAGTFANIVMMLLFGIVLILFFAAAFMPAGLLFTSYASSAVNVSALDTVNGMPLEKVNISAFTGDVVNLSIDNQLYYTTPRALGYSVQQNLSQLLVYEDTPAFRARIKGAITEFDYTPIHSYKDLSEALSHHAPGDIIVVKTIDSEKQVHEYTIQLAEKDGRAYLGLSTQSFRRSGFLGSIYAQFSKVKDPNIYYESRIGDLGIFIYDLLWWIVIINLLVALFNMYPAGILDGGRFLYLTVWGITGSKRLGEGLLKFTTWLLLIIVAVMMIRWVFAFF
ncbi:site-2 protease family protein [Candidatus Pacearchaeota archaeon]|nr:site-2 protease family protein [Candidatus Pacearchaeota archaeon]